MSSTAANAAERGLAERLGISPGALVQQLGEDDDIAEDLVKDVAVRTGTELVPADSDDVVDVVLLWFREDDGDLVDALVDARRQLSDEGDLWLLTPKVGREGHVEPSDILEAVPTAGLVQTTSVSVGREWSAMKLVGRKAQRRQHR